MTHTKSIKKTSFSDMLPLYLMRFYVYYILLVFSLLLIFIFYILFVNASRAHIDISKGLALLPGTFFFKNLDRLLGQENLFVLEGIQNSLFIALLSAILTTYFSALTAYSIHLSKFKGRGFIYLFILAV